MIQPVGPAGSDHREIVGMLRDVRIPVRYPQDRFAHAAPICGLVGMMVLPTVPMDVSGRPNDSGIGLPASLSSAGLGSNRSMWLGPPSMNSQMTDLAFGWMMRRLRRQGDSRHGRVRKRSRGIEQAQQSQAAQPAARTSKEGAARG